MTFVKDLPSSANDAAIATSIEQADHHWPHVSSALSPLMAD